MAKEYESVKRLEEDMIFRGDSPETIYSRTWLVKRFVEFIGKDGNFTRDDVVHFIVHLRKRGCKNNYIRLVFFVLRRLYKVCGYDWKFDRSDIPRKEEPYRPIFTDEEIGKLEAVAKKKGKKFYAMTRVSTRAGPRRVEVRNLDVDDFQPPRLRIETAKGGKPVYRELDGETIRAIQDYLATRRGKAKNHPALFLSSHKNPRRYSKGGLSYIFKRIREEAGIDKPKAGFHGDRRSFVTTAHESGLSETEITQYMGWKDRRSVDKYILLRPGKVGQKFRLTHPFLKDESHEEIEKKVEEKIDL